MHKNTLLNVFNNTVDRFDKKIDILKEDNSKIKKALTDLRESVQYHSDNVDKVNKKLEDIDSRVEDIKIVQITKDLVTKAKKKLADSEDRSRRSNVRFDGFQEETNETWEKVVKLRSCEVVIVNFLNFKDKSRILHTYREKKLQKEKIFVIEDFSEKTASIQKSLL